MATGSEKDEGKGPEREFYEAVKVKGMKIKEKKNFYFVMSEKICNFASRFYPILIASIGEDRDFGRFHLKPSMRRAFGCGVLVRRRHSV